MLPHCDSVDRPPAAAGRFASCVTSKPTATTRVCLIGAPDDTGVKLNRGRLGAAEGPAGFRAALSSYGAAEPAGWSWPDVWDAGDVRPASTLSETHDRVTAAVRAASSDGLLPVVIGGGHDLTFASVRGVASAEDPVAVVYFDPHLDVREEEGSGMPFRRIIEHGLASELHVFGLHRLVNSREHMRFYQSHGGRAGGFGPEDPWPSRRTYVSLDLDVIDQAYAPGVSAMNPNGWTPAMAEAWVEAAGRNPAVIGFDIMELSPPNDPSGRTARLAVHLFLVFLRGLAQRGAMR